MFVSIIIDNYNYARFLKVAIDSALDQTYVDKEVVVVDDGSTDDSREIITQYGDRIVPVLKNNGGQASAFNAGFCVAKGDIIIFLDSDDRLDPNATSHIVEHFGDAAVTKVQWLLRLVDAKGICLTGTRPSNPPPDGDLRDLLLEQGPSSCPSSPTSGNAWRRSFLELVMPIPEDVGYYRVCADEFLYNLAPIFGRVKTIPHAMGDYRLHCASIYSARPFSERLQLEIDGHKEQCKALSAVLEKHGLQVNVDFWHQSSWFGRLKQAIDQIHQLIPKQEPFLLVDDNTWGAQDIFGNRALPVMEHDGLPWGNPPDTPALMDELERQFQKGIRYFVLCWPAFWWLDYYSGLSEALAKQCNCLTENELLIIYELSQGNKICGGSSAIAPQRQLL